MPAASRSPNDGENVTGDTLARFYSLHVVVFPLLSFVLLAVHLYLVQKHGMSVPQRNFGPRDAGRRQVTIPFVPHFLLRDMVGWYVALALLAALAALFPWELGEKADPFASAPAGIKPEWYFLFMFQALKLMPAHIGPLEGDVVGILFFGVAGLAVLLVPFLDRGPRTRNVLNFLAVVSVVFFIFMTAWGWFSGAEELGRRILLGSLLTLIVLFLPLPFTETRSGYRQTIYGLLTLTGCVMMLALYWELLG